MSKRFAAIAIMATAITLVSSNQAYANPGEIFSEVWADDCGRFTIDPGGKENLLDPEIGNDFRIHLRIWDSNGDPIVGIPATEIYLYTDGMSTCPTPWSVADGPTDEDGYTSFSGPIYSGISEDDVDCDQTRLYVYVLGWMVNYDDPVCVAVDSPDLDGNLAVGVSDFGRFASDFNCQASGEPCDPCHDYNDDGQTGIADFAIFAGFFNDSSCP